MKKSGKWILSAAVVTIAAAVTAYFVKNRSQEKQEDDFDDFEDFDDFDEELDQEEAGEPFSREYVSLNRTHQTENADTAAPAQDASEPAQDTPEEEVTVSDAPSSDTIAEEEPGQE